MPSLDKEWFIQQLANRRKSLRALARHLGIDPSAVSRIFSGDRKMKLTEAEAIARFLAVPAEEVLKRAGVDTDNPAINRLSLSATIGTLGRLVEIEPQALPSQLLVRAQASLGAEHRGKMKAAQVRAGEGPLSIWDDAVLLWAETDVIEPAAVGVLSVSTLRDGVELLGHLEKVRKTGEATVRLSSGELKEVELRSAAPVLAVLP